MSTEPLTCPYCNALVTAPPGAAPGARVPCPRCGEAFPVTHAAATGIVTAPAAVPENAADAEARRRWYVKPVAANRRVVLTVLGIMALLASASLAYALYTQPWRRGNDKALPHGHVQRRPPLDDPIAADAAPVPVAELAALGWLPPRTSVLVGVHVRELSATDAGRTLLTQPVTVAGFPLRVDALARWTKIPLDDIDYLILGVNADDALPPAAVLLVRTRRNYDADQLFERLRAKPAGTANGRTVYDYAADAPAFLNKPALCCLDRRTVAYSLVPHHLQDLPATPRADLGQLPRDLRAVLNQRVRTGGPLWVAGSVDNWERPLPTMVLEGVTADNRPRLTKVRTFAAWVQLEDPVRVRAEFDCRDDGAARALAAVFGLPVAGVDPDLKAVVAEGWLTVQVRTSADKVRAALER